MLVLFLLLATGCQSRPRPNWEEGEPTPPPGPPEILSEGEVNEQWEHEDYDEEIPRLEERLATLPGLEITAVVSRAPFQDWEEQGNSTLRGEKDVGEGALDPLVVESEDNSLLLLSWWQVRCSS